MRKTFTLLVALAFALTGSVYAQCTPDPGITGSGIFPTPVTGVPVGEVGVPWAQTFTVNVPQDTTLDLSVFLPGAPTVTVTVNYLVIDSFGGLPPGLTSACNPASCNIVGGNSGCIEVAGTPTTSGQYVSNLATTLNVLIPASVPIIGGTNQDVPGPLAYNYEIQNSTSIDPGAGVSFSVGQSFPNPASSQARIDFFTATPAEISLEVFSLAGQRVFAQSAEYSSGEHALDLSLSGMDAGVYFYTISNGTDKVTRRLMVAR